MRRCQASRKSEFPLFVFIIGGFGGERGHDDVALVREAEENWSLGEWRAGSGIWARGREKDNPARINRRFVLACRLERKAFVFAELWSLDTMSKETL